jgi:hypothetical protein
MSLRNEFVPEPGFDGPDAALPDAIWIDQQGSIILFEASERWTSGQKTGCDQNEKAAQMRSLFCIQDRK